MSTGASAATGGSAAAASSSGRRRLSKAQPQPQEPFEPSENAFLKMWFARNSGGVGGRGRQALKPGVIPALAKQGAGAGENEDGPAAAGHQQPPRGTPVTHPVIGQRVYYEGEGMEGVIVRVDRGHRIIEVQMDDAEEEDDEPYELDYDDVVYA